MGSRLLLISLQLYNSAFNSLNSTFYSPGSVSIAFIMDKAKKVGKKNLKICHMLTLQNLFQAEMNQQVEKKFKANECKKNTLGTANQDWAMKNESRPLCIVILEEHSNNQNNPSSTQFFIQILKFHLTPQIFPMCSGWRPSTQNLCKQTSQKFWFILQTFTYNIKYWS